MVSEEERALSGVLFTPGDPELVAMKRIAHNLSRDYNLTYEEETDKRDEIIDKLLKSHGEGCRMQGPIFFHYGKHTSIGKHFFANFNFTVQDDALVEIGDNNNFGPNVTIVTPVHPLLPRERDLIADKDGNPKHMCYAKPVKIGNDCWFGAGVIVCSGVTIGNNCVIGAGSVVTKDIPDNSFAAGNPCRVIRPITESDSMRYKPEILQDNQIIK